MVLQKLTDSVNDTTRTARNTLSLVLLVGLYLGLTLVFSTDENLIRDSRVALPQVGVGISLSASYIVAPVIFLYLHFHLLFLLDDLKRKIQAFRQAIMCLDAENQYWNWLSSSAFVRSSRLCPERSLSSKALVWLSVVALPLMLLFAVFLSFVRYQSDWITYLHRTVFFLDLAFIVLFRSECFACIRERIGALAQKIYPAFRKKQGTDKKPMGAGYNSVSEIPPSKCISPKKKYISNVMNCIMKRICAVVWIVPIFMVLLVCETDSPDIDEDPDQIWRKDDDRNISFVDTAKLALSTAPLFGDGKYIDTVICKAWGLCRYLDISNTLPDVRGVDLSFRELRFAKFRSAKLDSTNFRNADMRGAYLIGGQLQDADLKYAKLQGANLYSANLQNANLGYTELQEADLKHAKLQRADLSGAKLQGTDLRYAKLQGADLSYAKLQNTYLEKVQLQGARLVNANLQGENLAGVDLQGANLSFAKLQAANLTEAQLQGARLHDAQLQCVNLEDAQLRGADIGGTQLQGSFGQPKPVHLIWRPDVSLNFPPILHSDRERAIKYIDELLTTKERMNEEPVWEKGISFSKYITKCVIQSSARNDYWLSSFDGRIEEEEEEEWISWAVEFACKNQYTAISSLKRWGNVMPLYSKNSRIDAEVFDKLKRDVRNRLVKAKVCKQKCKPCLGLHAISSDDDEWKIFVDS